MDVKISKFTEALTCFFMLNKNSKNKGLKKIRESRQSNSLSGDLTCLLDDLDSIDRFSEEIIPNFHKFLSDFESFLVKVYENKKFLNFEYTFLEMIVRTTYKIDNYCLKLRSLKITLIWLYNHIDSKNDVHPNFIINLLNTSCNVLENICLRRMTLAIINRLIKRNVKNKKTIMDKNEFFNLYLSYLLNHILISGRKGIGESILASDDFKVQELCAELIHELLPPRNSPMEFYNRRFDLFFALNSLSEDLKNEFFNMQNSGWMYSPKWLISLNMKRNCDSAPLTFECICIKLGENPYNPLNNDEVLFVHVSKNFICSVISNSKNKYSLFDVALKDVEEIFEFDNQIILKLKKNSDNETLIGDDLGFFNLVGFYFDNKSGTETVIQEIVMRIKKNVNSCTNIKCSMMEYPIILNFRDSSNLYFGNSVSQHQIIGTDIDKNTNFISENLIEENKFEHPEFSNTCLEENIEKDGKVCSIDSNETKINHQENDKSHSLDTNSSLVARSDSEEYKKSKEKSLFRVSTEVQDLFSLVTLEKNDKNILKDAKLPEKMKKRSEGTGELTNVLSVTNEISKSDKNSDSSIKQNNNNNNKYLNEDIYDFPLDNVSCLNNKSQIGGLRSRKKYILESDLSTYTSQKKSEIKNKLQVTGKKNSYSKDSPKNDYSSATDYDVIPNDFLLNNSVKMTQKSNKIGIKKRSLSKKFFNNKESVTKVESYHLKKYSSKFHKKIPKNINDSDMFSDLDNTKIFSKSRKKSAVLTNKVHFLRSRGYINYESSLVKNLQIEKQNNSNLVEESLHENDIKMITDIEVEDKMNIEPIDEYVEPTSQIILWSKDGPLNSECKTFDNHKLNNLPEVHISRNNSIRNSETSILKLSMVNEATKNVDKECLCSQDFITAQENKMKIEKDSGDCIYNNNYTKEIYKNFDNVSNTTDNGLLANINANNFVADSLNMCKKNGILNKDVNSNNFSNNFYNILNSYGLLPAIKADDVKEQLSELSNSNDYDSQLSSSDTEYNNNVYDKYFYTSKWRKGLPEHHRKTLSLLIGIIQIIINKLVTCELNINDYVLNFKRNINKIIEVLNMVRRDKRDSYNKKLVNHLIRIEKQKKVSENIRLNIKKGYLARKKMIDHFYNNNASDTY
ncbi:hypothetical protein PCANB_001849 [Pneumocystis canis]|nr:hypothetical protein PCANB_001849 [Pneumocystis canis]